MNKKLVNLNMIKVVNSNFGVHLPLSVLIFYINFIKWLLYINITLL